MLTAAFSLSLRHIPRCAVSVLQSHVSPVFAWGVGRNLCTSRPVNSASDSSSDGVTSHYAEVNGARVHYEKTGRGSHPVILMPGALGSSRTDFGPQLEKLNREKYTIYAFDPRGYGRSLPPERDWPLEFFQRDAEDAVALMQAVDGRRFSILGWSDGGITGIIMAGRFPQQVRRLVVWGANAYASPADLDLYKKIEDVTKWSERMREPFVKLYGMQYFQKLNTGWVNAFNAYLEKKNGDLCKEETKQVKCPTLIIHGDKDALVPLEHPDYLHANIPGSVLVRWPEGKHNLHLRYADEFIKEAEDFLDRDN